MIVEGDLMYKTATNFVVKPDRNIIADLLIVRLQAFDDARDAKVVVSLGTVQRPERKAQPW